LAGAAVVPLAAWGAMAMVMPASTALRGVLGAMPNLFDSQIVHMAFYRMVMGTDDIGGNSRLLLVWSFYLGLFVVVLAGAALACTGPAQKHRSTSLWLGAAVALGLWVFRGDIGSGWIEMARPLPLVMLVAGLVLLASACRARHDPLLAERRLRQLSLVAFAGLLLLKIVLNTRIFDYGFILAMPACLLVVVILLEWIPRAVTRMGGTGLVFAAPALGALAVAVAAYLTVQTHLKVLKTHPVADPRGGVIVSDEYGAMFNRILDQLRSTARPGQTLVVLPEGVMVNYLAGLRNPTPYITCAPLEMKMFSQGRVLDAFRSHPPDFIVLMPTDLSLWGYRRFRDYAPDLDAWITANYGTAWQASVTIRDKKQTCVLLRKLP
jgi:hypothetical protein